MPAVTRPLLLDDAAAIATVLTVNRAFLAPWQPARPDDFFTAAGQRRVVERVLAEQEAGLCRPLVIVADDEVVGTITLQSIIRGAFQSCSVGYWLAESAQGRGLATRALADAVELAFGDLRLHRVQAETLLHNERSRRILARLGFTEYGRAPSYMRIAGEWQDNVLFQLITPAPERVETLS